MSRGTKASIPLPELKADLAVTKPFFLAMLRELGMKFLGGDNSLHCVQWMINEKKYPMNEIECLQSIIMAVDLVRGAPFADNAVTYLAQGELGVRFTMKGFIGKSPPGPPADPQAN